MHSMPSTRSDALDLMRQSESDALKDGRLPGGPFPDMAAAAAYIAKITATWYSSGRLVGFGPQVSARTMQLLRRFVASPGASVGRANIAMYCVACFMIAHKVDGSGPSIPLDELCPHPLGRFWGPDELRAAEVEVLSSLGHRVTSPPTDVEWTDALSGRRRELAEACGRVMAAAHVDAAACAQIARAALPPSVVAASVVAVACRTLPAEGPRPDRDLCATLHALMRRLDQSDGPARPPRRPKKPRLKKSHRGWIRRAAR